MARGDKKAKVAKYLKDHPEAKNADTAKACGCSVPMVSAVKRELGLTRGSSKKKSSKKAEKGPAKSAPVVSASPNPEVFENLVSALEYVDSADAMLEILDHIEAAGGIETVRVTLTFHHRLIEAIG